MQKKMSDFDVTGFLSGMFKTQPPAPAQPAAPAPEPEPTTSGEGVPDDFRDQAGGPTSIPGRTSAAIDAAAKRADDLGDLLPADGEWDSLPSPEPCPTCGMIDAWWGLWSERHCERCEPRRLRSLALAERAVLLGGRRGFA